MNTLRVILILSSSILLTAKTTEAIIGGSYAANGRFKYQVSIQRNGHHTCGGTIIGDSHVLTAAHCFLDHNRKAYEGSHSVVANEVNLNKLNSSTIRIDVEKVYVPTDYNDNLHRQMHMDTGDIAVLKLKTNLGLDQNHSIRQAELPKPGITYVGVKAVASGYGFNRFENFTDSETNEQIVYPVSEYILRYVGFDVITDSMCQQIYGSVILSSKHLCGKAVKPSEGTCGGDSGGPLVRKNTIIGVVSSGIGACGDNNTPEVYMRVSSYLDFIKKAMSDVQSPIIYIPI